MRACPPRTKLAALPDNLPHLSRELWRRARQPQDGRPTARGANPSLWQPQSLATLVFGNPSLWEASAFFDSLPGTLFWRRRASRMGRVLRENSKECSQVCPPDPRRFPAAPEALKAPPARRWQLVALAALPQSVCGCACSQAQARPMPICRSSFSIDKQQQRPANKQPDRPLNWISLALLLLPRPRRRSRRFRPAWSTGQLSLARPFSRQLGQTRRPQTATTRQLSAGQKPAKRRTSVAAFALTACRIGCSVVISVESAADSPPGRSLLAALWLEIAR